MDGVCIFIVLGVSIEPGSFGVRNYGLKIGRHQESAIRDCVPAPSKRGPARQNKCRSSEGLFPPQARSEASRVRQRPRPAPVPAALLRWCEMQNREIAVRKNWTKNRGSGCCSLRRDADIAQMSNR